MQLVSDGRWVLEGSDGIQQLHKTPPTNESESENATCLWWVGGSWRKRWNPTIALLQLMEVKVKMKMQLVTDGQEGPRGSDGIQQLHKLLQLIASTSQYCQRCSQIPNKCQFDMTWIVSLQVWRLKHKWNIYSIRDALVSKRKHLFDQTNCRTA